LGEAVEDAEEFGWSLPETKSHLLGEAVEDAKEFGWSLPETKSHNWETMVNNIQVSYP
ncbi:hypothetical protein T484DRAFT_1846400, partial [Baffinella frigidus]